jgi:hypothetical protein
VRHVDLWFPFSGVACAVKQTGLRALTIRKRRRDQKGSVRMHTGPTLGYHQDVVNGMMDAREPFGEVETFIDEAPALDQDEKAALWLFAWSLREGRIQRREALAMLSALEWVQAPG